nr:MAG TPA: hypothetical protein [Caudoviricetes sp.]
MTAIVAVFLCSYWSATLLWKFLAAHFNELFMILLEKHNYF